MRQNILLLSLIVLLVISGVLFQCGDNPELVFPEIEGIGKITGYIEPVGVNAMIYLIDVDTIASTVPDSSNGYFSFTDIPYGSFKLKVVADSFGVITQTFVLSNSVYSLGTLCLNIYPSQIREISPRDQSSFSSLSNSCFTDSTINICMNFKYHMNIVSIENALSISPELPIWISNDKLSDYNHEIYFSIPVINFFQYPLVTLTLSKEATTVYFEHLDFDYNIVYYPDTTLLNEVIFRYFISETVPSQSSYNVDVNTDVIFRFRRIMNHSSVENAIHIEPNNSPNFFWQELGSESEELTIKFAKSLEIAAEYKIEFDTSLTTLDSLSPPRPIHLSFKTESLHFLSYSPMNGEDYVSLNSAFTYRTSFPLDSVSFINAFSSSPPIDSLSFRFLNNEKLIEVTHSELMPDTLYLIIIDSTLTTYTGVKYGKCLFQDFRTKSSSDTILDSSLIYSIYPSDTTELLDCNGDILIIFTAAMNKQSVEERISISPEVIFDYKWKNNESLEINQLQRLMSNTVYAVNIDSGYQTLYSGKTGRKYKFSFKTKPLRLESYYPLYGQVNVPVDCQVVLGFNTPVDSTSLVSNISFIPVVDSLSVSVSDSGLYYIDHLDFLPDTKYTILLNDSITDQYGVVMGRVYIIEFTTIK